MFNYKKINLKGNYFNNERGYGPSKMISFAPPMSDPSKVRTLEQYLPDCNIIIEIKSAAAIIFKISEDQN